MEVVEPPPTTTRHVDVWFDMETGDPDDCITLLLLLNHKHATLRGVSIYPGDRNQVGFIKALLAKYGNGTYLPVGSYSTKEDEKSHLGLNNVKLFGHDLKWNPMDPDDAGHNLLAKFFKDYPFGTMVTGGPLGNLYLLLKEHPEVEIQEIFIQGGFAGANCVPYENQLAKFKGLVTCPTFNFNGHVLGANAMLSTTKIKRKYLISKDVCHGVAWSLKFHQITQYFKSNSSETWKLLIGSMGSYLQKKDGGKLLHDPLAACVCIDPEIITFCEVEVKRDKKGHWGSTPLAGTNTWISVGVDIIKFYSVFLEVEKEKIEEFLLKSKK